MHILAIIVQSAKSFYPFGEALMLFIHSGSNDISDYEVTDIPVKINSCGINTSDLEGEYRKDDIFLVQRPEGRKDYQLIYIASGTARHRISGQMTQVREGDLIFYQPNQPQYYSYGQGFPVTAKWIHFSGSTVTHLVKTNHLDSQSLIHFGEDRSINTLFDELIREDQHQQPCHEAMEAALLEQILALAGRKCYELQYANQFNARQKMIKVLDLMHTHYADKIPLDHYAQICSMSRYHFVHQFTASFGISPHAYLTKIRLNHAKDLLENTSAGVGEIAAACGYENPLYFSRLFSKRFQMSPTAYRKAVQAKNRGLFQD